MRYRLVIDWMGKPHTSNDERRIRNRFALQAVHDEWRAAGTHAARIGKLPKGLPPCRVFGYAVYPKGQLPDCGAIAPLMKHVIDGLVDYGAWPDDTPEWVVSETYQPPVKRVLGDRYGVVVILEEVGPDDAPPPR